MNRLQMVPNSTEVDCAVLINTRDVNPSNKMLLLSKYLTKLAQFGVQAPGKRFEFIGLNYPQTGNIRKTHITECLDEVLEYCDTRGITTLIVPDSKYFPILSGKKKTEDFIGYVYPCVIKGYEHISILPSIHYTNIDMNPGKDIVLTKSLKVLADHLEGTYEPPGSDVLQNVEYPTSYEHLNDCLNRAMFQPRLAWDIETLTDGTKNSGLRFDRSTLATLACSPDKHSGFAFPYTSFYHSDEMQEKIRQRLRRFFEEYTGQLILHNGLFDIKFLIKNLYMDNLGDYDGMQKGIDVFKNFDDTMIIAYLCTNSTIRSPKGLKDLSKEFTGDYAENVKNIKEIPLEKVLEYNLKDTCATQYVYDKYYPMMVSEDQEDVYNNIFKPSFSFLLKMMMTGLPMDMDRVAEAKRALVNTSEEAKQVVNSSNYIKRVESVLRYEASTKYNQTHKVARKSPEDFSNLKFKPNSTIQLRKLFFDILGFEAVEKTTTGADSTNGASIKTWKAQATNDGEDDIAELCQALLDISAADKVVNTFIKAFEELGAKHPDGITYLNGNLKLGGTQSGRLASSEPNMQNLPSGSIYGKLIKSCFVAPKGWLFFGSDFSALEDRIGAILSGDVMKTKEFSDGLDGHSVRALAFFKEELPDIDINDVEAVNAIKTAFSVVRDRAKVPSFAIQYGGTWKTIQRTLGCSKKEAIRIVEAYHELYPGLAAFSEDNINFARRYGYIECAFGLKLRTPILERSKGGELSHEAATEGRSSSNAKTQSWGLLMNRALDEFNGVLEQSEFKDDVRLTNTIHDAGYGLVRATPEAIKFVNDKFISAMLWQEHPDIQSEDVKMMANLDLGLSWDKQTEMKSNLSLEEIQEFLESNDLI